ncbi:PREDICTED: pentatricopeptide repeat-containing protein At3g48250, chloroplastic-like isoform X2 [Tarenaya hassleriana]|uniref:pentatricopeptide repeat-containing protein At3g48250, chloroplastic-like isoform X2 n=1 Tax=Tarenaya hassleriana TaxID=28532 RepID=UPI00053C5CBA|nr:PREDICTED: pentatricopeptide repeat-containing protein At3g48250, chloroplastic-like isoform X2 [Tarenaya hassleriana]
MNRSKALLASLRHVYSFISTRSFSIRNQYRFFSSEQNSIAQLVLENDWSNALEGELGKSGVSLSHETAIYVLRNLGKDPEKSFCFFKWVIRKTGLRPSSSLYSLMLRILVQHRSMKLFWVTLREMKEGGFYLDEETYSTIQSFLRKEKLTSDSVALTHFFDRMLKENAMDAVVKRVSDVVSRAKWGSEVERELQDMKLVLSDNFVIRALKELRDHPLKALDFFHYVGRFSSYSHNTITYNAILRVLARPNSVGEFWSFVDEMKNAGHEMDLDTYKKISRQLQKSRMMADAVRLYDFMMDGPFKPSTQDCILLLRALSVGPDPDLDLVFRVARKYESTGYSLSKAFYDGIHRSLTSVGMFAEAEEMVNAMKNAGYEPDNITYSQLVFGLCKAKRFSEACKVLDHMEAQGCVPDIKTWTILIQGHCTANEVDKALICFEKMREKGFDIDSDLLDVLVNGFLCQNMIENAYKFFVETVKTGNVKPWQATYRNLIENLLAIRKYEEALDLLRMMKKQNYPAYANPFDRYLAEFGTVEDAKEFLKALSSKDYPSFIAYLNIFEAFFLQGRHSEAKDLLYTCPHHIRTHPKISELFGPA